MDQVSFNWSGTSGSRDKLAGELGRPGERWREREGKQGGDGEWRGGETSERDGERKGGETVREMDRGREGKQREDGEREGGEQGEHGERKEGKKYSG